MLSWSRPFTQLNSTQVQDRRPAHGATDFRIPCSQARAYRLCCIALQTLMMKGGSSNKPPLPIGGSASFSTPSTRTPMHSAMATAGMRRKMLIWPTQMPSRQVIGHLELFWGCLSLSWHHLPRQGHHTPGHHSHLHNCQRQLVTGALLGQSQH